MGYEMELKGELVCLYCNDTDLYENQEYRGLFVHKKFYYQHPHLKKYFYVMDDYSNVDVMDLVLGVPEMRNPFHFINKLDIYFAIKEKMNELERELEIENPERNGIFQALYPTIAAQEIVKYNEEKLELFLKCAKTTEYLNKLELVEKPI